MARRMSPHEERVTMGRHARPDSAIAKGWMRDALASEPGTFVERLTGEVNMTKLAEECAIALGHTEWLDDELHPVWEWSMQVAEGYAPNARGQRAGFVVAVYDPGASAPERVVGSYHTHEEAEIAAASFRRQAAERGWRKRLVVEKKGRHAPNAKRQAKSMEDATALIPEVVADAVIGEVESYVGGDGSLRQYADELADRARAIYGANADFAKKLRRESGRETLYSFMRHWLASLLKKKRPEVYAALPRGYGWERAHEGLERNGVSGLTATDLRKMRVSDEVNVPCGPAGENLFIKRMKRDEFFIRIPGHEHARWGTAQQAADDIEQFVQYGALPRSSGARMF